MLQIPNEQMLDGAIFPEDGASATKSRAYGGLEKI
jgi:hypothetical protein